MKIYNTLTRQKEELTPITPGEVKIYACGPTVYNYIHIGNARPLCVFDVLRRYLEYRGYKVRFVQNFTDIDDKIIRRANEERLTFSEVSEKYIQEFWVDARGMNIREATVHPKATENIDEIISIISTLVEKGYAYEAQGDVYFSPSKFPEYGKLSHQPLEELEAGARINIGEVKREPMDFALWKAAKPGEPSWDSPWGKGRPGWHIECSAMVRRYLGETIDIHCGGQDLIFPHHENEIAQSECCNGVPFAHYWMHNGFINVDNRKMSKSLGNFFTVRDVAKEYGYEPIRYLMISSQYRSPINYSVEIIEQCRAALARLYSCRDSLDFALKNAEEAAGAEDDAVIEKLEERRRQFEEAMDDDLNTADALAAVYEIVRDINTHVTSGVHSRKLCGHASALFDTLCGILGLVYCRAEEKSLDDEIEALIEQRNAARKEKNWAEADRIRDELKARNILLEDTPQGVKWKYAE
ncbi:MAG TPA: cysteine--tRNA ligase [Candidatus Fimivicinus intestinavium]|nr:cysteine--tRNA ligase [Candidatus Fimivicinus intestinavium]